LPGQMTIDFYCDDRVEALAKKISVMLVPHLAPGTKTETARTLAERVAALSERTFRDLAEPAEPVRCHTCDEMTLPGNRVRVAVCNRCAYEGRSPGCGH
jgi:hypothetical protein